MTQKFYQSAYTTSLGFPGGSADKESACNAGDLVLIPGLGRSPGEGKGYPLQYSGLENSMDCKVHGVAKSQIRWSDFQFYFQHITQDNLKKICPNKKLYIKIRRNIIYNSKKWKQPKYPSIETTRQNVCPYNGFGFQSTVWCLSGKESACNAGDLGDMGLISGLGRSPGGGNGNPLQYSCLGNSMDRAARWATAHGVAKSWTQLSTHRHTEYYSTI